METRKKGFTEYLSENIQPHSYYNNYLIVKHLDVDVGGWGQWGVPDLRHREFGNRVTIGMRTVSLTQAREAVDRWLDFNKELERTWERK